MVAGAFSCFSNTHGRLSVPRLRGHGRFGNVMHVGEPKFNSVCYTL